MEFKMKTDLEKSLPQVIDYNHEELKKELSANLEKYKNLVVTEDGIKEAKADRAKLNKLKEAVENRRKEVKKLCLAPYEAFEKKVKELVALIEQPIACIDGQVKAFEEKTKQDKLEQIKSYYGKESTDIIELLPFDKVFNPRWLNATYDIKEIAKEIDDTLYKVRNDLKLISAFNSEFELQIKDKYLATLDLSAALAEKSRLEEQKAKVEQYEAQQAAKEPVKEVEQPKEMPQNNPPQLETLDFRVWVTPEQKTALKAFLTSNNIKYGRVK